MIRNNIIRKIRERIDEVGVNETISLNFPIEAFITEAANQTLMNAPLHIVNNIIDFSSATTNILDNGSGYVELPDKFMRLIAFQMEGWQYEVKEPTILTPQILKKQTNRVTRAGDYSPIVALDNQKLLYFNVDKLREHKIVKAIAQVAVDEVDNFPIELADALSWLAASKTLQVMNEKSLSDQALSQYMYVMSTIK